jgi:proline dehydrogenase
MWRSLLIYLSKSSWLKKIVTQWNFAWRAASRFIAGESIEDAIRVIKILNQKGINATLDHLGEHTNDLTGIDRSTNEIIQILQRVNEEGICTNISIKLSQIGLGLNEDLCRDNLSRILAVARETSNFVRIDMEDASCVDATLNIFHGMLELDYYNVGLVIQSYLYRSEKDVSSLIERGAKIRLCKGAYKESANVAYPKKQDVDTNYDNLARLLMDKAKSIETTIPSTDCRIPPIPALATHDETRINHAIDYAKQIGLPQKGIEFQMLYGIRRDLQDELIDSGYSVRVYVPYGTEWYPYFTRRLAERPANFWFFISNFIKK